LDFGSEVENAIMMLMPYTTEGPARKNIHLKYFLSI